MFEKILNGGSISERALISAVSRISIIFEKYLLEFILLANFNKIAFPVGILE